MLSPIQVSLCLCCILAQTGGRHMQTCGPTVDTGQWTQSVDRGTAIHVGGINNYVTDTCGCVPCDQHNDIPCDTQETGVRH